MARPKKCVPVPGTGNMFCLENMTWFILVLLVVSVGYLYYTLIYKPNATRPSSDTNWNLASVPNSSVPASVNISVDRTMGLGPSLSDPYIPPLKTVDIRGQPSIPIVIGQPRYGTGAGFGLPVNISTSSADMPYQQIGILTKTVQSSRLEGGEPTILPLMGRNLMNGRDKWQYYTVSNTNNSVRLPVSVKGRSCTSEYGCDSIYNGDTIYVEGYDDTFKATIYENSTLRYIPV